VYVLPNQNEEPAFIVSIPMKDAVALTGMLRNLTGARTFELVNTVPHAAYHVLGTNPDLPQELFVACSDDRIYVSPTHAGIEMLYMAGVPRLGEGGVIAKALKQYVQSDVTAVFDATPFKPMLGMLQMQFGAIPPPVFAGLRFQLLRAIPPPQLAQINTRLRLQAGIRDVDQALDYVQAALSASYETLVGYLGEQLQRSTAWP